MAKGRSSSERGKQKGGKAGRLAAAPGHAFRELTEAEKNAAYLAARQDAEKGLREAANLGSSLVPPHYLVDLIAYLKPDLPNRDALAIILEAKASSALLQSASVKTVEQLLSFYKEATSCFEVHKAILERAAGSDLLSNSNFSFDERIDRVLQKLRLGDEGVSESLESSEDDTSSAAVNQARPKVPEADDEMLYTVLSALVSDMNEKVTQMRADIAEVGKETATRDQHERG